MTVRPYRPARRGLGALLLAAATLACATDERRPEQDAGAGAAAPVAPAPAPAEPPPRAPSADRGAVLLPNFVLFLTDDQGYGDLGCYGGSIPTPHADRMAREGVRFTHFYAQPACGPARAALLTGCYPMRVAEPGNTKSPHTVLHPGERTIAEVLRERGYATAAIGKWHLAGPGLDPRPPGGRGPFPPELMPRAQGFDRFLGTPMHNGTSLEPEPESFVTELHRDGEVVESPADMDRLTRRYTDEALAFLEESRERPFFLYLAHTMPHIPLGVSEEFRGRTGQGLYADVVHELDASLGELLAKLAELGIDERTLVLFASDNGPWIDPFIGEHAGSAGPLRGYKMTSWEGGVRVPAIARWPGRVPAGRVCDEVATVMDLLPTFAALAGAELPAGRVIDGHDLSPLLLGAEGARSPWDVLHYYVFTHLQAVREGRWKLVLPRPPQPPWTSWYASKIDSVPGFELYDLVADPGEERDLSADHSELVLRLRAHAEVARAELGDFDRVGSGARFLDEGPRRPDAEVWPRAPAYDEAPPAGELRFDFEDGLDGWRVVEGGFELPASPRPWHPLFPHWPYNRRGEGHLSTLDLERPWGFSDAQTGVLASPAFVLRGGEVSLLVGGGQGEDLHVALVAEDGAELARASGPGGPLFRRVRWDVTEHVGRTCTLRLVDRSTRTWGHLMLDDVSLEGERVD